MEYEPADSETIVYLQRMRSGDRSAGEKLYSLVYDQLHRIARSLFAKQTPGHTLQPTALVNEAFLRLAGNECDWQSRKHFIDVAAKAMRHILVDHARGQKRVKRGGDRERVHLTDSLVLAPNENLDLLALEEALEALEARDARKSRIVTLKFFGGLTMTEIGDLLEISPKTVEADWYFARAWLQDFMEVEEGA